MSRIPYPVLLILTAAALAAAAVFSLSWGRYPVPLDAVWQTLTGQNADETYQNIIFNLRLPRIAAAILSLMADLAEDGYTVVNTTHNPEHPLLLHGRHPQSQTALLLAAALLGVGIYYWQGKSQSEHLRQEAGAGSAVQSGGSQAASEVPLANGNMVVKPMEEPQAASGTASTPAAAGGELVINTRYRTMLTVSNARGEILINQIVPARSEHRFKDGAPYEVRLGYAIGSTASYGGENIDIDSKRKGKTAVFTVGSTVQAASAPQ